MAQTANRDETPASASTPSHTPTRAPVGVYVLLAAGVLILLGGLGGLLWSLHVRSQQLTGPTISDTPPAPDFTLTDQNGQPIHMAALRGKVVALTFLYTNCPDVCPLIASKLGQADQQLGSTQAKVALLAVTVDPLHDTPGAVRSFDAVHGLQQSNWHYLLGSVAQLTLVWKSYYIGTDAAGVAGGAAAQASAPPPTQGVDHTAIVYLIDPQGRLREALDANFTVSDFVHDVKALAQ